MSLFFVSNLNQPAIIMCRDRSDDESAPSSSTPVKGEPSKNPSTSGNIASSTHSDLRGGEADRSITSEDTLNTDSTGGSNKTTRSEATKAEVNNHVEGYYSTEDGKPQPSWFKTLKDRFIDVRLRMRKETRAIYNKSVRSRESSDHSSRFKDASNSSSGDRD